MTSRIMPLPSGRWRFVAYAPDGRYAWSKDFAYRWQAWAYQQYARLRLGVRPL